MASSMTVGRADVICGPNRTPDDYGRSHFAMWIRNPAGPELGGVYASVYKYTPYVTPVGIVPGTHDETVEQMGLLPGDESTIIQSGFMVWQGSVYDDFCEIYDSTAGVDIQDNWFSAGPVHQSDYYASLYKHDYNSQGQPELTCEHNGIPYDWLTPPRFLTYTQANVFGETHDWTSQMPGTASDNASFTDAHIYCNCVGGWTGFGAHNPGSPQDYQCVEFTENGGTPCVIVNVNTHGYGGGSYYNGVWGTIVFERTTNENTLGYGDLTPPCA